MQNLNELKTRLEEVILCENKEKEKLDNIQSKINETKKASVDKIVYQLLEEAYEHCKLISLYFQEKDIEGLLDYTITEGKLFYRFGIEKNIFTIRKFDYAAQNKLPIVEGNIHKYEGDIILCCDTVGSHINKITNINYNEMFEIIKNMDRIIESINYKLALKMENKIKEVQKNTDEIKKQIQELSSFSTGE